MIIITFEDVQNNRSLFNVGWPVSEYVDCRDDGDDDDDGDNDDDDVNDVDANIQCCLTCRCSSPHPPASPVVGRFFFKLPWENQDREINDTKCRGKIKTEKSRTQNAVGKSRQRNQGHKMLSLTLCKFNRLCAVSSASTIADVTVNLRKLSSFKRRVTIELRSILVFPL